MDTPRPLSRLTLAANSVADDLGFVALADIATALQRTGRTDESRIIGGHMVMLHVHRWGLGRELYRESQDVDLGIPPLAVKDDLIIDALREVGYERLSGNRYVRRMSDLPVRTPGTSPPLTDAAVDILTPAYTSRPRDNVQISEGLTTTEVPGLAIALKRPGVDLQIDLQRLNGETLTAQVLVPDEVSGVVLKALAWRQRAAAKDAVDLWRTLEVAFAAGLQPADFDGSWASADRVLREAFPSPDDAAMRAITASGNLGIEASRQLYTRVRALIERIVP